MGQPAAKSLNAVRTHAPPVRPAAVTLAVETEALLRSTLDSLSAHIAVLDASGMIVAVNNAWRAFARQSGYVGDDCGVGSNYLSVCEAAASESSEARATAQALRDIMSCRQSDFRM